MKKYLTFLMVLSLLSSKGWGQTTSRFNDGFLTVFRVTSSLALASTGTAIVMDEYHPTTTAQSAPNFSVALPSVASGLGTNDIVVSGTATASGQISRSENGRYILIPGYNALIGAANTTFNTNSVVRTLSGQGAMGSGISGANYSSGNNNLRGATSDDGTNFWMTGNGLGIIHTTISAPTTLTTVSSTSINNRAGYIFNGQLYLTTGAGTQGIYAVGTGKPVVSATTATRLFAPTNTDVYGFSISPDGLTVYYVAASTGGIYRSVFTTSWSGGTLITTGFTSGTGIAVDWTNYNFNETGANGAVIYASNPTSIVRGNDNGTTAMTLSTLRTISGNNAFRGISFSPIKQTISLGLNSPTASNILQGGTDVVLGQFNLAANEGNSTIKRLIVNNSGTASISASGSTDLTSLRLYLDSNGNGIVDGADNVISTGTISGSVITFSNISPEYIEQGNSRNYLIVGNVSASATSGSTFIPTIQSTSTFNSVNYTRNVVNASGSLVTLGTDTGVPTGNTLTIVASTPSITVTPSTLSGFAYTVGSGPSAQQSFTVSGSSLSGNISITPPSNYEISTQGGGLFEATNPITLSPASGTVSATTIYVRLKAGLAAAAYNSETIDIISTGADPKTVTCSGDVWAQIEWANLQWPGSGTIDLGGDFTVYAQVYQEGVTQGSGQGAGIQAWIGYSTTNTNPAEWNNWVSATYNTDAGNNDEYSANIGAAIFASGTYYYASRFKSGNADYVYGGFQGGFWNGSTNVSGTLTINAAPQLDWVNLQWPENGNINTGGEFIVYAQAFKAGVTPGPGAGAGISAWIGYNTDDTDPSTWSNWVVATYHGEFDNNDEYSANIGSVIATAGTYYYASRFKYNTAEYVYGGYSSGGGGFWDGTNYVSGILTVQIPEPSNHATGFTASYTPPTTTTITLNWTDATPAAEAYLIKGSSTSFAAITAPSVGTPVSDGTLVKNVLSGVQAHTFTGLTPSTTYYFKIWPYNGTGAQINFKTDGSVPETSGVTAGLPVLSEVILPQYMQGLSGTNNSRIPFAYRANITNLTPNATYRYFNQIIIASDEAGTNGAGNAIYALASGDFVRTTTFDLTTSGRYGEFTTNESGSYTGWFITEPTGNARFAVGNLVYPRIMLNDGNNGTLVVTRLTATNPVTVLNFGTTSTAALGTGLYGNSYASDKNFVLLYDNTDGTGRPLMSSFIESDGTTGGTTYPSFYQSNVDGQSGRWGAIIPNDNANGVKRVEYRKLSDGNLIYHTSDNDGIWGGVNTVNPTGGTTALVMPQIDVENITIASGGSITIPANGTLTVSNTLTNNAGNTGLVIKSNASGTGSLLHNSNNVPATIERYITGNTILQNTYDYHLVSVPLNAGVTAAQFLGSYLYRFNVALQQWQSLGTSLTTPLANDQGYMIFYPNNFTTYNFVGQLNNGSFTAATPIDADHFALVPNPYPSAIDWDAASGWTKSNIRNAVWIWNPVTDQYATYGSYVGVNAATQYIPAGQAFFVKSNAASPVLSMNNNVRVHNSQAFFKSGQQMSDLLRIHAHGNNKTDEIVLRLREGSLIGLDDFDVDKLFGAAIAPQLFTTTPDGRELAINNIPADAAPVSIPMGFQLQAGGQVNLSFEGLDTFKPSLAVMLEDLLTGTTINLRETPTYSFNHSITNSSQRFMLHLTSITTLDDNWMSASRIWTDGRDICIAMPEIESQSLTIELFDPLGKNLATYRRSSQPFIRLSAPASGVMLVRISNDKGAYSSKVFIR